MKEDCVSRMFGCYNEPKVKQISFTLEGLKEYYKTIKDRNDISDSYKLKIANEIIEW